MGCVFCRALRSNPGQFISCWIYTTSKQSIGCRFSVQYCGMVFVPIRVIKSIISWIPWVKSFIEFNSVNYPSRIRIFHKWITIEYYQLYIVISIVSICVWIGRISSKMNFCIICKPITVSIRFKMQSQSSSCPYPKSFEIEFIREAFTIIPLLVICECPDFLARLTFHT